MEHCTRAVARLGQQTQMPYDITLRGGCAFRKDQEEPQEGSTFKANLEEGEQAK